MLTFILALRALCRRQLRQLCLPCQWAWTLVLVRLQVKRKLAPLPEHHRRQAQRVWHLLRGHRSIHNTLKQRNRLNQRKSHRLPVILRMHPRVTAHTMKNLNKSLIKDNIRLSRATKPILPSGRLLLPHMVELRQRSLLPKHHQLQQKLSPVYCALTRNRRIQQVQIVTTMPIGALSRCHTGNQPSRAQTLTQSWQHQ